MVVLAAAQDYTRFMLADLKGVPKNDRNGSQPMKWPLHIRTINYRWDSDGVHTAYVQLVGSLSGWLMAGIALVATVGLLISQSGAVVRISTLLRRCGCLTDSFLHAAMLQFRRGLAPRSRT
jgi:hypothetical protein